MSRTVVLLVLDFFQVNKQLEYIHKYERYNYRRQSVDRDSERKEQMCHGLKHVWN